MPATASPEKTDYHIHEQSGGAAGCEPILPNQYWTVYKAVRTLREGGNRVLIAWVPTPREFDLSKKANEVWGMVSRGPSGSRDPLVHEKARPRVRGILI